MYFDTKSYLKSTHNHTAKHAFSMSQVIRPECGFFFLKKKTIRQLFW